MRAAVGGRAPDGGRTGGGGQPAGGERRIVGSQEPTSRGRFSPCPAVRPSSRFCRRASLVTFKRFEGDTVWCPIETAAYDLEWQVGDLATQIYRLDGMSNG